MKSRRVVVTGIGAITPIGTGSAGLWDGVRRGTSAVRRITRFDPSPYRSQVAAEISDFDPLTYLERRTAKRLDRFAQLGVVVARRAVEDAGLDLTGIDKTRVGVSIGSALGGVPCAEDCHTAFLHHGTQGIPATLAISVYGGASGANIAIDLDLRGPNSANAASCASGAIAIGTGFTSIKAGDADIVLAGGVEAPLAPLTFAAFSLIKAMSARNDDPATASRPFDAERDGFVMAEGAAVLVLEERNQALHRGARIYAELAGFGQSNDAYHMTAPRPDGSEAARAVCLALREARIQASDVEYVNAHATGTPLGDAAETCALRRALGIQDSAPAISSTKGLYGHALGASGAIEAAITALALHHGFLPGTTNLVQREERCPLHLLPPEGCERRVDTALTTSFGFGGVNAALVLKRVSS
ncbi:MAG: beta-ketoacyl-ACP synthase II [Chloroflexota bacterium]|nr:beta-ketoacyl-ACP synthase II [Chloroflexota bacterium]